MTHKELQALTKGIAPVILEAIKRAVDPLKREIAELQSRQAISAAKAHVNFCGTFTPGRTYGKGSAVTRQGALWIALEDTSGVPGGGTPELRSWQLAVKSGAV